jgi:phospholipid-translocating ATPase
MHVITTKVCDKASLSEHLKNLSIKSDHYLVIDGGSLQLCLDLFPEEFCQIAMKLPAMICCRCSPQQKADITNLIKRYTKSRIAAIGDGGNDVSMIQAAHVGIGIVGKEGKQASLAADFSLTQFCYLPKLILYHGRNNCKLMT